MGSSKSSWEIFFKEAGIPSRLSAEYATIFCDNRMRLDMLEALDKEVLQDLGVKAVGDIISILRHAKIKQKEMSRQRSSSPEVQILPKKPTEPSTSKQASSSSTSSSTTTKQAQTAMKINNISMTVKADAPNKSTNKPARKTLSERFGTYEKEAKIMKSNEDEIKQQRTASPASTASKQKAKQTVFTIQLPSKKPSVSSKGHEAITAKETEKLPPPAVVKTKKVTLVPAQGKTLNRNKQSTSIFDRLDNKNSSSSSTLTLTSNTLPQTSKHKMVKPVKPKQDVFSRLGDSDDGTESSSPKSVFSRLGDK